MPLIENVKQYTLSDLRWLAAQDVTPEAKEMLQDEIKRREASITARRRAGGEVMGDAADDLTMRWASTGEDTGFAPRARLQSTTADLGHAHIEARLAEALAAYDAAHNEKAQCDIEHLTEENERLLDALKDRQARCSELADQLAERQQMCRDLAATLDAAHIEIDALTKIVERLRAELREIEGGRHERNA